MSLFTLGMHDQVKQIDHYEKKIFGQDPNQCGLFFTLSPLCNATPVVFPLLIIGNDSTGLYLSLQWSGPFPAVYLCTNLATLLFERRHLFFLHNLYALGRPSDYTMAFHGVVSTKVLLRRGSVKDVSLSQRTQEPLRR